MSRILKAPYVRIDEDNRVSVQVMDAAEFEQMSVIEEESLQEDELPLEKTAEEILESASHEAAEIVKSAEQDGQMILRDAKEQAERLAEKLKEQAVTEGREEGYAVGVQEAESVKREALGIRENALKERKEILASIEPETVDLIIGVVERLLGGFVRYNPDMILCLIRQGLSEISSMGTGNILVHVSPDDYEAAIERRNDILSLADTGVGIEILKDLSLRRSDCVIETPFGNIDCSLDQQFQSLKENLYYILGNR